MPCLLPCELCEKKPPTAQVIIGNPYTEHNSNSNSTGLSSTTGLVSSKAAGYVITTVFSQ